MTAFKRSTSLFALLLLGASLVLAPPAVAADDEATKLAKELMELSGGMNVSEQIVQMLSAQLRPAYPLVPEDDWNAVMSQVDPEEVKSEIAAVYTKHFTKDELQGLVNFYRSKIGKRLVELLPVVMQESMVAGGEWNQRKANEIIEALKAKGHNPPSFNTGPAPTPGAPAP